MRTVMDPDNRRKTEVDLHTLSSGDTVTVVTESGSSYHLTKTSKSRLDGRYLYGISVMTDSTSWGQMTRPPRDVRVERVITLGRRVLLGNGGSTSSVQEIYLNEQLIASR